MGDRAAHDANDKPKYIVLRTLSRINAGTNRNAISSINEIKPKCPDLGGLVGPIFQASVGPDAIKLAQSLAIKKR